MSDDGILRLACHEIGHGLMARQLNGKKAVDFIEINGGDEDGGQAVVNFRHAKQAIMIAIAGAAAEFACFDRAGLAGGDERDIKRYQTEGVSDEMVRILRRIVHGWAVQHREEILRLAKKITGPGKWKLT
jgi:hypothetical protein